MSDEIFLAEGMVKMLKISFSASAQVCDRFFALFLVLSFNCSRGVSITAHFFARRPETREQRIVTAGGELCRMKTERRVLHSSLTPKYSLLCILPSTREIAAYI